MMQVWQGGTDRLVLLGECALAEPKHPWPEYMVVLDRTKLRRSPIGPGPGPITTTITPFINFHLGLISRVLDGKIDTDLVIKIMPGDDPAKLPGWCAHYG